MTASPFVLYNVYYSVYYLVSVIREVSLTRSNYSEFYFPEKIQKIVFQFKINY